MGIAKSDVEEFFSSYEALFRDAIEGHADMEALKQLYSDQFIAATPHGVRSAAFDGDFEAVMAKGYERYRELGTKSMQVAGIDVHDIDDSHVMARVRWQSAYQQPGKDEIQIAFDVNYLLERRGERLKVFGWITGDEQALLKAHGIT